MTDFTAFTPGSAAAGGALIGLASVLLLWADGRIAGVSGIAGGLLGRWLPGRADDLAWRLAFLVGLILGAAGWLAAGGTPPPARALAPGVLVAAGLLVGYGTALGSGCTSGHGVCGLARRSRRSFVAVGVFLLAAFATVFVVRHGLGG